ncbi:MAG: hypothetical protein K2J08_09810 [Ruminococcus sp.]|nr:hypothetical protein [Ruminococcus sp.]
MIDIDLYFNCCYCGFYPFYIIEEYLEEYSALASVMADSAEKNEIVLYAVITYNLNTGRILSADFMLIKMTFERYSTLCRKLSIRCRTFYESAWTHKTTGGKQ